jgi:hypothetical protein
MIIYFDIQTNGISAYSCLGTGGEMLPLHNLDLGEQAKVSIKDKDYALGALVRMLIEFKDNNAAV